MTARITLTIVDGPLQGKTYSFDSRTLCWVGRQSSCTIQFSDVPAYDKISRLHCLIDIDPPRISIRDFNSKQGTYVDSVLIGRRESEKSATQAINNNFSPIEKNLCSGNIIAVGDVHIKVTITGEQPDYSPPPTPRIPNAMQLVADRAIGLLKNL
jgi:eukaryotic-like serine/threonine-protein kinase